ncbi:MAG: HEAT repeat domain-containing protein [Treponema sp.]|nr:HEAT repeat domain-containing protein [Treponema sp.]
MKNKTAFLLVAIFSSVICNSFAQSYKIQFIKGNIQDKTLAVREASGQESEWLTNEAISFVLENKSLLGEDRELEGLAVAAILSIPNDFGFNKDDAKKTELVDNLITLFKLFNTSNTVQISVLSKYLSLRNVLPPEPLTKTLNEYLQNSAASTKDAGVLKSVINSLGYVGNNVSFTIIYNLLNDKRFTVFTPELEQSLVNLLPVSMNEALRIIKSKDTYQMRKLFDLVRKNKKISQNFLAEIAENVLNESILIVGNSSEVTDAMVLLQMDSISVLSENKWTRSSAVAVDFFSLAKIEYNSGAMSDSQMTNVVRALANIAPVGSVAPLTAYLGELNGRKQSGKKLSEDLVLAVIKTLGAIGDKSAFDTLLTVTYLDYQEEVLSAARDALAGLRW